MPKSQTKLNPDSFTSFGELLRYLREREQLTQRELAALVGYHHSYVGYLEKNLRVVERATLLGRFVPALNLDNESEWIARLLELVSDRRPKNIPVPVLHASPESGQENIFLPPSLTSMLGREREVASINKILQSPEIRVVTIVGPPGVGKTCLALHIAQQVAKTFTNGAVFVNLTSVIQAELVLPAIASALGIRELAKSSIQQELKNTLHKKNMLIVMDNFEQVVEAAPQLIPLLGDAPGLKILVTSREALRIRGEQEVPLAPLPLSGDSLLDSPAVQLFIERARAVKPDFQLDEQNASYAAEICRRLDGLPLAIELAAARVQTLSLSTMIRQFDRRFEWLTRGGRDLPAWRQTLWGALEWSYNLLDSQERALLNRLSVFSGGWTMEAAEAVCSDDVLCASPDIFNLLMQLVDKSLVVSDGERYHFLETLREFAGEKLLKENHELDRVHQLHCEYYLKFTQEASPHILQGGNQAHWLDRMEVEHNNLRAALTWSTAGPDHALLASELVVVIREFWYIRSHFTEARRWLEKILSLNPAPTLQRARLLRNASDFASVQGDYEKAYIFEEQAFTISKELGDEAGVYLSMDGFAMMAGIQGDYTRTAELLEQVLVYRRQTHDLPRLTTTLNNLAIACRRLGNIERARQLYMEAIAVSKNAGNKKSLAYALIGLAEIHMDIRDYAEAAKLQRESISIRHQLGDQRGLAFSLDALAISSGKLSNNRLATQLKSASERIRRELGLVIAPATRAENKEIIEQLRINLGDSEFESAWNDGQTMSLEEAMALAMTDVEK